MYSAASTSPRIDQPSYCEQLNEGSEKYTAVSNIVNKTWRSDKVGDGADSRGLSAQNYSEINIKRVFEVNNPYVTAQYEQKRVMMSVNQMMTANPATMPHDIATKGVRGTMHYNSDKDKTALIPAIVYKY